MFFLNAFMSLVLFTQCETRNFLKHFGDVPFKPFDTEFLFLCFKEIRICEQHNRKTQERIFITFSGQIGHETRNNIEHFLYVAANPLDPGWIFQFSGSVFSSNIM